MTFSLQEDFERKAKIANAYMESYEFYREFCPGGIAPQAEVDRGLEACKKLCEAIMNLHLEKEIK